MAKKSVSHEIDVLTQLTFLAMASTPAYCKFQTPAVNAWLNECLDAGLGNRWSRCPPDEGVTWSVPLRDLTVHIFFPDMRRDGQSAISEAIEAEPDFVASWYKSIRPALRAGQNHPRIAAMLALFQRDLLTLEAAAGSPHPSLVSAIDLINDSDLRVIYQESYYGSRITDERTNAWSEIRTSHEYAVEFFSPAGTEHIVLQPVKTGVDGRECWYICDHKSGGHQMRVIGHLLVEYGVPLIPALMDSNRQFSSQSRGQRIMQAVERILEKESLDA